MSREVCQVASTFSLSLLVRRPTGYRAQQAQGNHHQALVSYSLDIAVEPRQAKWYYLRGKTYEALAAETEAKGAAGRAREMRGRAQQNFAAAQNLDPITDFAGLEEEEAKG